MLLNNLYIIKSLKETNNQIQASVLLSVDHDIFRGHFPGQPVLPGACMLEMITEVIGEATKQVYRISGATMIKFLRMIDPEKNPLINLEIKYQTTTEDSITDGRIFHENLVFMKFQMKLVSISRQ